MTRLLHTRSWIFGLVAGACIATLVTAVVTTWEWLENPGGIFHDASGTNWRFIMATATSWLIPTFMYAAVVAAAVRLLWGFIHGRRENDQ